MFDTAEPVNYLRVEFEDASDIKVRREGKMARGQAAVTFTVLNDSDHRVMLEQVKVRRGRGSSLAVGQWVFPARHRVGACDPKGAKITVQVDLLWAKPLKGQLELDLDLWVLARYDGQDIVAGPFHWKRLIKPKEITKKPSKLGKEDWKDL